MTQRPPEGGDDNALRANGFAAVLPRPAWVTLSERKWVSFRGPRGAVVAPLFDERPVVDLRAAKLEIPSHRVHFHFPVTADRSESCWTRVKFRIR